MAHSLQVLGIFEYHFFNRWFCFLYNKVVRVKLYNPEYHFIFFNVFCKILFSQVLVKSNRRAVRCSVLWDKCPTEPSARFITVFKKSIK